MTKLLLIVFSLRVVAAPVFDGQVDGREVTGVVQMTGGEARNDASTGVLAAPRLVLSVRESDSSGPRWCLVADLAQRPDPAWTLLEVGSVVLERAGQEPASPITGVRIKLKSGREFRLLASGARATPSSVVPSLVFKQANRIQAGPSMTHEGCVSMVMKG